MLLSDNSRMSSLTNTDVSKSISQPDDFVNTATPNKYSLTLNSDIKLQLLNRLDSLGYDKIIHQSRNIIKTSGKKIGSPTGRVTKSISVAHPSSRTYEYSIADLIADVKTQFDDTFSDDVYKFENKRTFSVFHV